MKSWLISSTALALACAAASCTTPSGGASALTAPMTLVSATGAGASVGDIAISNGSNGVVFALHLHGLPPGDHGFHLHANGSCDPGAGPNGAMGAAVAAGGHYDPANTGRHEGPTGAGHMGDLPLVHVGADGTATERLVAPHLHVADELRGHALIIHANGDNYSDTPAPLGGGGGRIACGVVR